MPGTDHSSGSGIGLSLVREYVDLHKGQVEVKSDPQGSTFTVYLPDEGISQASMTKDSKKHPEKNKVSKALHVEAFSRG